MAVLPQGHHLGAQGAFDAESLSDPAVRPAHQPRLPRRPGLAERLQPQRSLPDGSCGARSCAEPSDRLPQRPDGFRQRSAHGASSRQFPSDIQLSYIRTLAEFISQPQYSRVVAMFSPVNEPNILLCASAFSDGSDRAVTQPVLETFYTEAYRVIRSVSGLGAGNGPMIAYHACAARMPLGSDLAAASSALPRSTASCPTRTVWPLTPTSAPDRRRPD